MTDRVAAGHIDDFGLGTSVTIDGLSAQPIAVFRTESGEFFATQDSCTHEQWSLGEESDLEGTEIVCPLHMARFDLRTGEALCLPATIALQRYPVEVAADGSVWVIASSPV